MAKKTNEKANVVETKKSEVAKTGVKTTENKPKSQKSQPKVEEKKVAQTTVVAKTSPAKTETKKATKVEAKKETKVATKKDEKKVEAKKEVVKKEVKAVEVKQEEVKQVVAEEKPVDVITSPAIPEVKAENEVVSTQEAPKEEIKPKKRKLSRAYLKSPLNRVDADPEIGLNEEQLQERIDKGFVNVQQNVVTKSYWAIFRSNVLTLFNLINFVLGCAVFAFGAFKNGLFLGIVFANMVIGIFQEVRSKKTLEKMSILTSPTVDAIRSKNGVSSRMTIQTDAIALDDIIILKQGDQVPVDCMVVGGICDANESLLTGEADDIHKVKGDVLYSGSTIQAGEVTCRVTAVGAESYSAKLLAEAKKFKKTKSKLMNSINWIIRIVSILIFPLGTLMFLNNFQAFDHVMKETVTRTVSSIIGMIPEGLMVLTSIALAAGVYKLAKKNTLVQDLYSIETLARVDVLCLDKTGTITEGSMQVEQVVPIDEKYNIQDIIGNMVKALGPNNATFQAFSDYFHQGTEYEIIKKVPFSSARKWSAVDFGINKTFIVGAPEFVLKDRFWEVEEKCEAFTKEGFRVLCLVTTREFLSETMDPAQMKIVGLIVLSDKIRENAHATFEYFAKQGVTLKVISGDNPITVSKVAERAGLQGADKYIDASKDLDTYEKIYDACDKYTIFGRVSPKQKKQLVQALKSKGYTVGMTGDGVNDVMALKEADCSIAMAAGSSAARSVSQLVLLDSDFASLPSVVSEGRRVINNIERAASLFLVKTTFSALLTILCIAFSIQYPFEAIQLTLVSSICCGIPSFFLALEPNNQKVTGGFLSKVFKKALPAGFTIALFIFLTSYTHSNIGINVSSQVSTMATYIYAAVAYAVLLQVCMPYTKERVILVVACAAALLWCMTTQFTTTLFSLYSLTPTMYLKTAVMVICVVPSMVFMRVEIQAVIDTTIEMKRMFRNAGDKVKSVFDRKNIIEK